MILINMNTKLKEIRENEYLSQRELANILKISKSTYARWETQEQTIPLTRLNEFCNYFNVSMDYAMGLSKTNEKTFKLDKLDRKTIGLNLKQLRKNNNATQEQIASLLNTSHSTISAYESGKTLILTIFAVEICKKYNYSLDKLCNKKNNSN